MQNSIQNLALMGNAGARFLCATTTTREGFHSHAIVTKEKAFALALYEEALNIADPNIAAVCGTFTIEFICADDERDEALLNASRGFTC